MKEAEFQEDHLRRIGAILNSCSRYHRGAIKKDLVEYIRGKNGEDYSKSFMTIGDNPSGQATSTAKYVVITCARSKADEVKKWMRDYFPLNEPYQELAGRMVGWIFLNRHIPQVMWERYNKHQINFQTIYRHKLFHNLDPDVELDDRNTMITIMVREALARLQSVTKNRLLTGIERNGGGGTLLLFDAQLAAQV